MDALLGKVASSYTSFSVQFSFFNIIMVLLSLSSTITPLNKIPSSSFVFKSSGTKASHNFPQNLQTVRRPSLNKAYLPLSYKILIQRRPPSFNRSKRLMKLPLSTDENKGPPEDEEECRAMETLLKLYTAIKNKNMHDLSHIIGDECRCVCNFMSCLQFFHRKKQVMGFLSYLMKNMGTNFEFIVQPSLHDGMNIGISWTLEWKATNVPLMKGFSFYTFHIYKGKLVIRNVEMVMEPLLHIEPIRRKMKEYVMNGVGKMGSKRSLCVLLVLFFMAVRMFFSF